MGLQLIFAVETNKECKSDWIYIKETIDRFFTYDSAQVKLNTVYLGGKGNYKSKESQISALKSQYAATSKANQSQVILCIDCDDYDTKMEDKEFLENAEKYCRENSIEFVWFCKDIEQVYIGKKVPASKKKEEAAKFKAKKKIETVDKSCLDVSKYAKNTSNIVGVLRKYLREK